MALHFIVICLCQREFRIRTWTEKDTTFSVITLSEMEIPHSAVHVRSWPQDNIWHLHSFPFSLPNVLARSSILAHIQLQASPTYYYSKFGRLLCKAMRQVHQYHFN